ncbi:MAG: efflux RND transporter periplasmic adaptor subunit [Bacteroidia bacterium]
MKNHLIHISFSGIFLLVLASCGNKTEQPKTETGTAAPKTMVIHKSELSQGIRLPGELKAFQEVDIYAKLNSFVKEVKVDRGSQVKQGQELILLDAPELDAQYAEALQKLRSKEALARSSTSYYRRLLITSHTPGTVSANDLEQAEAKMNADSAEVNAVKSAFQAISDLKNYLVVKAPFDGMISERNVHPGAYAGPSGKGSDLPMLRMEQEGLLRLVIAVPEIYIGALHDGLPVKFRVKAFPSDTFQAVLKRVSGKLDEKTRAELIEMDVENKDHRLLPGMYAEVEIGMTRRQIAFVVPATAVMTNTEGVFVIRIRKGTAEWIAVTKGNRDKEQIEIFGALEDQDEILLQASDQIRNGQSL